jgi:L-seryl-tRNA(Ser) seleniumtransferase
MIRQSLERIGERARQFVDRWGDSRAAIEPGESVIGGGSTPEQPIPTFVIAIGCDAPTEIERQLRTGTPPVIARIERDRLIVDLRTVFEEEEDELMRALGKCLPRC